MPTVYHVDQPGAPQTGGGRFNTYILDVLKACLVYGYGSVPGAGWTLVDEASEGGWIVLQNATLSGYLCLALENQVITISMSETYDGVDGYRITGAGAITGIAAGAAVPHRLNRQYIASYSSSSSWFVIADGASAVLCMAGNSGSGDVALNSLNATYAITLYLGDDSNGTFMATGGHASTSNGAGYPALLRGLTVLRNPATGLLVYPDAVTFSSLGFASDNRGYTWSTVLPEVSLAPGRWLCEGVYGALRGIVRSPDLSCYWASDVAKQIGVAAGLTARTVNSPSSLGDGYTYFSGVFADNEMEGFLVTDNPEFW